MEVFFLKAAKAYMCNLWINLYLYLGVKSPKKFIFITFTKQLEKERLKRFRGSWSISVCKEHKEKSVFDVCDLGALRHHCMKNLLATMINGVTWAQEKLGKPFPLISLHLYPENVT